MVGIPKAQTCSAHHPQALEFDPAGDSTPKTLRKELFHSLSQTRNWQSGPKVSAQSYDRRKREAEALKYQALKVDHAEHLGQEQTQSEELADVVRGRGKEKPGGDHGISPDFVQNQ
jgi:hypothetical protein